MSDPGASASTLASPATTGDPARRHQSGWLIATSFLTLFAIVGIPLYGLPFYYDFFVRELGWTRAQVTSGNALGKLVVGPLFGFLIGWLIDRFGPRRPMIVGLLLAGVALAGLSTVTTMSLFLLFYGANSLAYVLAGPLPNQVLLSRHFSVGRGRAMGIAYLGIGVGFFFVTNLSSTLSNAFGWRWALRALGVILIAVALPLVLRLKDPARAPDARTPRAQGSLRSVLRSPSFYLLLFGSMASIGAVGGANQNLKLLLSLDYKWSQSAAAFAISLVAIFSLAGRIGAGWLADRIGPKRVMLIIYSLVLAAIMLLLLAPSGAGVYPFAVIFGLGLGGEYLIIPLMAVSLFGTAVLGRVMGIVLTADGIAEALLPVVVGKLRDMTGNYDLSFQLLAVTAALGAAAIALLPRRIA